MFALSLMFRICSRKMRCIVEKSKRTVCLIYFLQRKKYAYDKAAEIITISEDIKTELESKGVNGNKIKVVYNWSYQDKPFERSLSMDADIRKLLPRNKFNVVYAGNIGVMQNVEIIIEAARKSEDPDVLFHIFGDGAYKQKLIEKASGLNNVKFWPMQPVDKAPAYMPVRMLTSYHLHRTSIVQHCQVRQQPVWLSIHP